ncbi:MAG: peroxidase-related enzyme [Bacteroidales bacterium]|nr:peroxidase-related enzyme [Bacteroidales bacterium]MCF8332559.1 peroxidase-related enzyme [Bacteroidales bacterium]
MARIQVIQHNEADGRLLEIYNELIDKRGKLAEIHKIQSLRPESILKHIDLYLEIMFTKSELSRADREMMAVVVSVSNNCEYCKMHHGQALNHYWKNWDKIHQLEADYTQTDLDKRQKALCRFAQMLTEKPGDFKEAHETDHLKNIGLSDKAILDATMVVAYFNFVNRIVLALDVQADEDEVSGYKY